MANRNRNSGQGWSRNRGDYGRGYDQKSFNSRPPMNPWQGGVNPVSGSGNILPMSSVSSEATTLALANNLIALLGQRNNVPSLLDMPPVRRDFGYDRGYGDGRPSMARMGKQGPNFNRRNELIPRRSGPHRKSTSDANRNKPPKKNDSTAKSADSKEDGSGNEKANGEGGKTVTEGQVKTKFDVISAEFLHCHICDKRMWDGRSFQNHLNGRAHNMMMAKTKESYNLTSDAMRHELKIFEMKRIRRNNEKCDFYCAMCDLYVADGASHRTSIGHRRLKKYLHPSCNSCRKEMPTRIEFDEHRLTLPHLKILQEKSNDLPKAKEAMIVYTLQQEMNHVKYPKSTKFSKSRPAKKDDEEEAKLDDTVVKTEEGAEGETSVKAEPGEAEGETEAEMKPSLVLDIQEETDFSQVKEENIPGYDIEVGVGKSFIADFTCKQCNLCEKLLDTEETAEVHLKTWKHFKIYLLKLREKAGLIVKKDVNQKRSSDYDDDGNFKRRKLEDDDTEDGEGDGDGEGEAESEAVGDETVETSTNDPDTEKLVELIDEEMKGNAATWEKIDEMLWQENQGNESAAEPKEKEETPAEEPVREEAEAPVVEAVKAEENVQTGKGTPRGRRGRSKKY